ncbi:MAG: Membrane-anchored nucleotide-binding enzyme [Schlesneria sp.]|nr:Membrane-anchored nucleotide-binding enzyme [Schlesneria sp.]
MGFYIRKSVRVGPLRFNLSTAGIGVSTGIPGLRVGTGPRGTYVHMGRGGLYYRQTVSPNRPRRNLNRPLIEVPTIDLSGTHAPLESIGSVRVAEMVDTDSEALLSEIQQKHKRIRYWPIVLVASLLVSAYLVGSETSLWIAVPCMATLLALCIFVHQHDQLKKSVVLMYDLDGSALDAYRNLFAAVDEMARCGAVWHVTARGQVYDPKYHAGAGQLINRNSLAIDYRNPPYVKTNLSVPCLPFGRLSLYLLPDRVLVYDQSGVGTVGYNALRLEANPMRFIEDGSVPRDAVVIDHAWRYVNKDGSPDRRFNNNRQIPVCQYEELRLTSSGGLQEVLHLSRVGISSYLQSSISETARSVRDAVAAEEGRRRLEEQRRLERVVVEPTIDDSTTVTLQQLHEIAFDVMCCIMAADGRASVSEKAVIREIMRKLDSGWSDAECEDRLMSFIGDIRNHGYASIVKRAMSQIPKYKQAGRIPVLLKCIDMVAGADGRLSQREQHLCDRIRKSLGVLASDCN